MHRDTQLGEYGDYTQLRSDNPLPERGLFCLFFEQAIETTRELVLKQTQGGSWSQIGDDPYARTLRYTSLPKLERALSIACQELPTTLLWNIRSCTVPLECEDLTTAELLAHATQAIDRLPNLMKQLSEDWLQSLLKRPHSFFNVYQPLIDLRNGRVLAYEMLIRARSDDPNEVIGGGRLAMAAVNSRQIFAFDTLARETAIRTAARSFPSKTNVFINLMPNSIVDADRDIEATLKMCNAVSLAPSRVVFEVVETESIKDMGLLRTVLQELRSKGFNFALDDLGSGYSGLSYMLELHPDYVKLDREIVDGSACNVHKRVVLSKLVEAAHEMAIRVVAEGVETLEDFKVVRDMGIDIVQGYFVARPDTQVFPEGHDVLSDVLAKAG